MPKPKGAGPERDADQDQQQSGDVARTDVFVENEWVGRTLAIGDDVQIGVALPDPRCVMPSLAQEDLPKDSGILKALARHNRIDVAGAPYPCAGVYAVTESTGTIRKGDPVSPT